MILCNYALIGPDVKSLILTFLLEIILNNYFYT